MELLRESTSPIMLKFGLEIALGMIQKSGAAICEILIFRDFSVGLSPKFSENCENLNFDLLKNSENSKCQKSPQSDFVSAKNVSASTNL